MRPIKLTEKIIAEMQEEFRATMEKARLSDGKITYTKEFAYKDGEKATVAFNMKAFSKMNTLVQGFDVEIAWHGVTRRDPEDRTKFYVDDILVYPQEITGTTVEIDEAKYAAFKDKLEDEVFNNLRLQGHSHVSMATSPSGTDKDHQKKILDQLPPNDYYIFMIVNKKGEMTNWIFDLKNNVLYENQDITVLVEEERLDLRQFLTDAKAMAPKKTYQTVQGGKNNGLSVYNGGTTSKPYGNQKDWYNSQRTYRTYDDPYDYYLEMFDERYTD